VVPKEVVKVLHILPVMGELSADLVAVEASEVPGTWVVAGILLALAYNVAPPADSAVRELSVVKKYLQRVLVVVNSQG